MNRVQILLVAVTCMMLGMAWAQPVDAQPIDCFEVLTSEPFANHLLDPKGEWKTESTNIGDYWRQQDDEASQSLWPAQGDWKMSIVARDHPRRTLTKVIGDVVDENDPTTLPRVYSCCSGSDTLHVRESGPLVSDLRGSRPDAQGPWKKGESSTFDDCWSHQPSEDPSDSKQSILRVPDVEGHAWIWVGSGNCENLDPAGGSHELRSEGNGESVDPRTIRDGSEQKFFCSKDP
ncbi:MAG: hypothetical protein AAF604_06030 [Acidobacteriota bacterium]